MIIGRGYRDAASTLCMLSYSLYGSLGVILPAAIATIFGGVVGVLATSAFPVVTPAIEWTLFLLFAASVIVSVLAWIDQIIFEARYGGWYYRY